MCSKKLAEIFAALLHGIQKPILLIIALPSIAQVLHRHSIDCTKNVQRYKSESPRFKWEPDVAAESERNVVRGTGRQNRNSHLPELKHQEHGTFEVPEETSNARLRCCQKCFYHDWLSLIRICLLGNNNINQIFASNFANFGDLEILDLNTNHIR